MLALNFTLAIGTSSTPRYVSQISFDILSDRWKCWLTVDAVENLAKRRPAHSFIST